MPYTKGSVSRAEGAPSSMTRIRGARRSRLGRFQNHQVVFIDAIRQVCPTAQHDVQIEENGSGWLLCVLMYRSESDDGHSSWSFLPYAARLQSILEEVDGVALALLHRPANIDINSSRTKFPFLSFIDQHNCLSSFQAFKSSFTSSISHSLRPLSSRCRDRSDMANLMDIMQPHCCST